MPNPNIKCSKKYLLSNDTNYLFGISSLRSIQIRGEVTISVSAAAVVVVVVSFFGGTIVLGTSLLCTLYSCCCDDGVDGGGVSYYCCCCCCYYYCYCYCCCCWRRNCYLVHLRPYVFRHTCQHVLFLFFWVRLYTSRNCFDDVFWILVLSLFCVFPFHIDLLLVAYVCHSFGIPGNKKKKNEQDLVKKKLFHLLKKHCSTYLQFFNSLPQPHFFD